MSIYIYNILRCRLFAISCWLLAFIFMPLSLINAQIVIGGHVYGGGNAGDVKGSTTVTVREGDLDRVFGGARMANVEGRAFVNIDGANASNYIVINRLYGGNDIAGTIGTGFIGKSENQLPALPTAVQSHADNNDVDETWNALVLISSKVITPATYYTAEEAATYNTEHNLKAGDEGYVSAGDEKTAEIDPNKKIYIGQLFGGGDGEYTYGSKEVTTGEGDEAVTKTVYYAKEDGVEVATSSSELTPPVLGKTFLDIHGGSIVYAYGGGNNATVTEKTVISVDNPSKVVNSIIDTNNPNANKVGDNFDADFEVGELLTTKRFRDKMGINTGLSYPSSDEFQIGRFFGGNNKAEMTILPKWNLQSGRIRNLYSGGNRGDMTSPVGLLLEIPKTSTIVVDNVFGGCRMANVRPKRNNQDVIVTNAALNAAFGYTTEADYRYHFPDTLSARVLIRGGDVNNVYGGNDVTGKVVGGNAVGVYTSIRGDVFGGGNGSYPYTDNKKLENNDIYGDLYYNPGSNSVAALNAFRPNAEAVSLRVAGNPITQQNGEKLDTIGINPTIIGGAIYVGGNSATLKKKEGVNNPMVELKIGSYVIADKVFLGNNGYNMVQNTNVRDILRIMATHPVDNSGNEIKDKDNQSIDFSSINFEDPATFSAYMDGCAMDLMPRVVFDNEDNGDPATYIDYKSYFGSIYCGGNVGSMTKAGTIDINFGRKIVVYDKVVGGCNTAYVPAKAGINAEYVGGIIGASSERDLGAYIEKVGSDQKEYIKNRLILNFNGLKIQPKRWRITEGTYQDNEATEADELPANYPNKYLVWNTVDKDGNPTPPVTTLKKDDGKDTESSKPADMERRFIGGNIYGGCYDSGVVNGNVVINLNNSIVDREILFDEVAEDEEGEAILYGHDEGYTIEKRHTGVILGQQGMDVLGTALNVFGGGKGRGTEIWGSATINLNAGYTFQIFGGSEQGVIGRPKTGTAGPNDYTFTYTPEGSSEITKVYGYDSRYSCYVNLAGQRAGVSKRKESSEAMAECEFMYGGGFFGPICGNTVINLGKGRIFNSFAGSCNADILGHTETYIGRQVKEKEGNTLAVKYEYKNNFGKYITEESTYEQGFPWIRDIVYGGNDLGGRIMGEVSFKDRVRKPSTDDSFNVINKVHKYNSTTGDADVLKASAYVEYLQGRADAIFGGCYGTYDYTEDRFVNKDYTYKNGWAKAGFYKPRMNNAFVNFRPTYPNGNNVVKKVYGAGQGQSGEGARDSLQNRSYVLIDIPQTEQFNKYSKMEVFGAGAWGGVGMGVTLEGVNPDKDKASAIIDLIRGDIGAAYGASYKEGVTRRTLVNVPVGSTIKIGSIFGGAYGTETLLPCDVYESNVEYHSGDACLIYDPVRTEKETNPDTGEETTKNVGDERMKGAIYGGNNQERRTIYTKINIDVPVKQSHYEYGMTHGTVYGAGCGEKTWAEYTEVNLDSNMVRKTAAAVYEVYGGGEAGRVLNAESVQKYMNDYYKAQGATSVTDPKWIAAWKLGGDLDPTSFTTYVSNAKTNLSNPLVRTAEIDDRTTKTYKYNTNVIIGEGAKVLNYAYGGGLGKEGETGSGDVYGTTYIALLGGEVTKDIYAAGTRGAVYDLFNANFMASTTAYIAGGTCRNVYGGGWQGDVGFTTMTISEDKKSATFDNDNERPGETHVVIGIRPDQTDENLVNDLEKVMGNGATKNDYGFLHGVPAIQRNAYSGGEGGAVFGTANLVVNNAYVGYGYHKDSLRTDLGLPAGYYEMIEDKTYTVNKVFVPNDRLKDCGNLFGGGYDVRSSVDYTNVTLWNGNIRNSIYGGGEIATIGRGAVKPSGPSNSIREFLGIYKAGKTTVKMYNGHVMRNVFAGGKGYNLWGYGQQGTLYTDGYVFGQTEVNIHGGEIGTKDGVAKDYGNVFGGGDIGFVWSKGYADPKSRVTNTHSPGHTYYYYGDDLIEDCKVVIAPELQVKTAGTIGNNSYEQYAYVTTDDLNLLPKKDNDGNWTGGWENLYTKDSQGNDRGITIHNGVFGGGNVSSNSDTHYANSVTVFGNTTATLYDVYHRDFITVGTEHTGGLYGGGNLSLVDGYRELNITNYGTDYYGLDSRIDLETYRSLSNRERAYFQLEYVCIGNSTTNSSGKKGIYIGDEFYEEGQHLTEENYLKLIESNPDAAKYWEPWGFCSIYAGRLLNTIQRADFCGVYGSRMVLQGAKDRVADVGEKIDYTINRVGEVSLNKKRSVRTADAGTDDYEHGNYFGIYSLVNCLGNLTSDVHFNDPYVAPNGTETTGKTFYSHKKENYTKLDRNKGISINQVALASGVFLELTTENSTAEEKEYGLVTGVVGLDLINVKTAKEGGGFVYAKNEHRVPLYYPDKKNVLLSEYNKKKIVNDVELRDEARTYKRFRYSADDIDDEWTGAGTLLDPDATPYEEMPYETSGNFIHKEKDIVDDCYPTNNAYKLNSPNHSPAHYWYVKGKLYIYDQKVSAYTGSANAYSKEVHLPLTITAASHGKLQLLNVKPNLYAYKMPGATENSMVKIGSVKDENGKVIDKVMVNNESDSYELNDVITWWDWHQLPLKERQYFVAETYVNCVNVTVNDKPYETGSYVMDDADFDSFKSDFADNKITVKNAKGEKVTDLTTVFRSSNNIGHDAGYVLTLDMNSPTIWDDYYSPTIGSSTYTVNTDGTVTTTRKTNAEYEALLNAATTEAQVQTILNDWREGPTFTPVSTGVYGKRKYTEGQVVTKATWENAAEGKDNMEPAYVAKETVTYTYGGKTKTANVGTAISVTEYNGISTTAQNSFAAAKICTTTLKITDDTYLLYGQLYYEKEINDLKDLYTNEGKNGKKASDIDNALTDAYYCTVDGEYGGQTLTAGTNYGAIQAWCSLPRNERITNGTDNFTFNYDAFDLLADNDYLKVNMLENDSPTKARTTQAFHSPYTDEVDVEYRAVYNDDVTRDIHYTNGSTKSFTKETAGASISHEEYETIRNDKRYYTKVDVKAGGETVFFATSNFIYKGVPYGKGQIVDSDVFNANTDTGNTKVEAVAFDGLATTSSTVYYCYENYTNSDGYQKGSKISPDDYVGLTNDQQYFVIQGMEPTETTTLYVSSESDAQDVLKERIYSVVYQYTYYENEDDGSIKMTNELHVINIHLELESGAPTIGPLSPPSTVLPGNAVGLSKPDVNPGLYEVLTSGWELFTTYDDAVNYRNGIPFVNNDTPVYWYQNEKNYIAFYSKTWLGKTYSNVVPLSVANYHDLDRVMQDKKHHMYVDRSDVDRDCKIYIDNRTCKSDNTKSELDLLKDFFDLSLINKSTTGMTFDGDTITTTGHKLKDHTLLSDYIKQGANLEFFLRSDVSPRKYTASEDGWTPIGDAVNCFAGKMHGDGYTVSGLSQSLFGNLCGKVYNLGVTGSFTGSGVADSGAGHVENCWVKTTKKKAETGSAKAVFGGSDVVNSYFDENQYASGNAGTTAMPTHSFYNGEVAYNLNAFYLNKRYYDHVDIDGTPVEYRYLDATIGGTLPEDMTTGAYPASYATYEPDLNKPKGEKGPNMGYVENRFYDGDFRYSGGDENEVIDLRTRVVTTTTTDQNDEPVEISTTYYVPIWPDDYLFFGQALNYDHMDGENGRDLRTHQDLPSRLKKSSERITMSLEGNRIYRAPAYYGSSEMGVAYFNPYAVFAQTKKDDSNVKAYEGMTAIDFTGGNGDVSGGYKKGQVSGTDKFYPPLLDDGGLQDIYFADLTRNILAYTDGRGTSDAADQTNTVVSNYLEDKNCVETDADYRTIADVDVYEDNVHGHWVQLTTEETEQGNQDVYKALRDHLLVDKQDFNCPISYTFAADKRMWYQREPERYVSTSKGWDVVSLPFTAELVTTQDKGEITHFYGGSKTVDANGTKIGHEYWLREHRSGGSTTGDTHTAVFDFPAKDANAPTKTVTNTYLWDHYYSQNSQLDANADTYQTFYKTERNYDGYAMLGQGSPYIIGFPGKTFYEFDLSGEWSNPNYPKHTADPAPVPPGKQTITFASVPGIKIAVSDDEILEKATNQNGYTFVSNYMNTSLSSGYTMNVDGDQFIKASTTGTEVAAFRPYFIAGSLTSPAPSTRAAQYIVFDSSDSSFAIGDDDPSEGEIGQGGLLFGTRRHTIIVTSSLKRETDVRIVNVNGQTITSYNIQPGETIETPVYNGGVYIIRAGGGHYTKKVSVK